MQSSRRQTPCRFNLERLEPRETPARVEFVSEPIFTPTGNAFLTTTQTPFPSGYGTEWSGLAEVTAPTGAASGTYHPGSFAWSGFLELAIQPDAGETLGTPVTVYLSSSGQIRWDLDPKTASGSTTNSIHLRAGLEEETPWFDLQGGQNNPNNSSTTTSTRSGTGFVAVAASIGDIIRVEVQSSGQSDAWVLPSLAVRGKVSAEVGIGALLPPDLVAGPIRWNRDGTVTIGYDIRFRDLDPAAEVPNGLIWLDQDDAPVSDLIPVELAHRTRGSHEQVVPLGPPPPGAVKLQWHLNSGDFADEQDYDNNISEAPFVANVSLTQASFDGDNRPDVIGRFFSGVPVSGQSYVIQISPELATFVRDARQIRVQVGATPLRVEPAISGPGWDGLTYRTATHDPGRLFGDTPLRVQVLAGGRVLAQTAAWIDVEPLPLWLRANRSWTSTFDPLAAQYSFAGSLVRLSAGSPVNPGRAWLRGPAPHRLDLSTSLQVTASLDPTRSDLLTVQGTGRAAGIFHNRTLFDLTGPLNSSPFSLSWNLDPRTLNLLNGQLTLNIVGQNALAQLFGATPRNWLWFQVTPQIDALVDYTAHSTMNFLGDGRLDPMTSTLSFDYRGTLSGSLDVQLPLGPTLGAALFRLRQAAGVPDSVLQQIHHDLTGTASLPSVLITTEVAGQLDVTRSFRLAGSGLVSPPSPRTSSGRLRIVPTAQYTLTWPGGSFSQLDAVTLARYFAWDRTV